MASLTAVMTVETKVMTAAADPTAMDLLATEVAYYPAHGTGRLALPS
jgi:hypothetical protein